MISRAKIVCRTYICAILLIVLTSFYTQASECNMSRSCEDLGYTTNRADCPITNVLACPFDTSKVRCPDCSDYPLTKLDINTEIGATAECPYDRTLFKYTSCTSGYTLADGNCTCDIAYYTHTSSSISNCMTVGKCESNGTTKYRCVGCKLGYNLINGVCENQSCPNPTPEQSVSFTYTFDSISPSTDIYVRGTGTIDWGDCTSDSFDTSYRTGVSHTYASAGIYDVHITGNDIYELQRLGNPEKITKLIQVNLPNVQNYSELFNGAENMTGSMDNVTLPSSLTDGSSMFDDCSSLTGSIPEIPSSLTKGRGMFSDCYRLTGNIPELPSSLTDGFGMFFNCSGLTGNITNIPSGLTDGTMMFYGCGYLTGNIPELPSSLTNGSGMFSHCYRLTGNIPTLPSSLTDGSAMFNGCSGLTGSIPTLPSSLTNGESMFAHCDGLTGSIPELPSSLTNGSFMFNDSNGLTGSIPELPSSLTDGAHMFYYCEGLTGTCPTKPSSLTSYYKMYGATNITCDYGK